MFTMGKYFIGKREEMRYVSIMTVTLKFTTFQPSKVKYIMCSKEREKILLSCHNQPASGHMGVKKTLSRISERFYWAGMSNDVKELVSALLAWYALFIFF